MRQKLNTAMKEAMKSKETRKLATIRLINAAIKDRDIAVRSEGKDQISDQEILQLLQKMVKQREDSAKLYDEAGRKELADQEKEEIEIIKTFLPKMLSEEETQREIEAVIKELKAESIKDMGKVMNVLKERFAGQIDFPKTSGSVKSVLMK